MRVRARLATLVPPTLVVVGLLLLWEVWVRVRDTPSFVLPPPSEVARATTEAAPLLPEHLWATATETLVGLVLGAALGLAVALAVSASLWARRALGPLLVASQTIPLVVLAPLFLLWFGLGPTPKVLLVALITFFPVAVATVAGLDGADPDLVEMVRALGAGRGEVLRRVRLPSALPAFFAGLRISATYAVAGAVIAEANGGDRGLGVFINRSRQSFLVDRIFVAVAAVIVLSAALYALVGWLGRLATPWLAPPSSVAAPPARPRPEVTS